MSNKNPSKTKVEKSLNTLVLIIILLSFGLVGSLLYESNITANNKITGQVAGMEGVSGFATHTLNPQGKTISAGQIIDTTQLPVADAPSSPTPPPRAEGPQQIQQNRFKVEENQYEIVTIYKNPDESLIAYINAGTPILEGEKIKDFRIDELKGNIVEVPSTMVSKEMLLSQWRGNKDKIPLSGNGERKIDCAGVSCTATDTYKDKEVITKTVITSISDRGKKIEKSKTAYFYEGEEITKKEYDQLKSQGKEPQSFLIPTSKIEEEIINGRKYLTRYEYETKLDSTKKPIIYYEATKINQETGELNEFIYGAIDISRKTTHEIVLNKNGEQIRGDTPLLSSAKTALLQFKSRQFFSTVERVLTEFQGLGYYATLFFDEDSLLAWRDSVDKAFATLYLGTEYWSSEICGQYLDGEDIGIAYAETPQGLAQVGAHIEATRTEPIIDEQGQRTFIYKITFNIRNGDYEKDPRAPEEMNINVILKGEKTATVFKQDQKIKRGSTFGKVGKNSIVQDSPALFNQVCIKFDNVPFRWKLDNKELCNEIIESAGEATKVSTQTTATASSGGGGTNEINDF